MQPLAQPPRKEDGRFDDWMFRLWKRIASTAGLAWELVDKTGSNLTDIETRNHADLQNINTASYTHLSATNHTDLTDGGATTLHKHDHNGQDGLQGGTTAEYYHLTSAEYTGTGTGNFVRETSPTLVTPALGTPSSGTVTNLTGTASININGTVGATTPDTGAFTTLSSTGDATLGDSLVFDAHTLNGKTTANDLRFASVQATLPAITIVDHCFHLAKDDTDKGAWRKRKGQSWRSETRSAGKYLGVYSTATTAVAAGGALTDVYYNTTNSRFEEITATGTPASTVTYRAGKEDYPTNALITAVAQRVIIWDLDGAVPSMWGVLPNSFGTITSVACINQRLVIGSSTGVWEYDFLRNSYRNRNATALTHYSSGSFTALGNAILTEASGAIVNATVNDVAITILPDAPLDENRMPVTTIAVGTEGGVSTILDDGTAASVTPGVASCSRVAFDDRYNVWTCHVGYPRHVKITAPAYNSQSIIYNSNTIPATLPQRSIIEIGDNKIFSFGSTYPLSIVHINEADSTASAIAYVTSTYNTGYMVGNIRGAWLANSVTDDRSVKANDLTQNGTVTETTQTGGLSTYSGWSAANNLTRASDGDWDTLGTGAICMMGWFKCTGNSAVESLAGFANAGGTVQFIATLTAAGLLECIDDGATASVSAATTFALDNSVYHHFAFVRTSSTSRALYVDGKLITSNTTDAGSITDTGNLPLYIGVSPVDGTSTPATTTTMALMRLTATAPTAEQIADIYAQEAPLFASGATCLLSNSDTVTGVRYHNHEGLLEVKNGAAGAATNYFAGLQRVGSVTTTSGITGAVAEGQVPKRALLTSGTTNKYWSAERNVSAELLEAQVSVPRTQQYSFTTPAATTTQAIPRGWKAQGIAFNTTDSTFLGTYTQTFDGFIWNVAGLTASKAYQINLVEVVK